MKIKLLERLPFRTLLKELVILLSIAEECLAVIRLADSIVDKGNINAVSDMG